MGRGADELEWGVFHADDAAFRLARAALRVGVRLTSVCDGPEQARVPARRVDSLQAVLDVCDILIIGGPDAYATATSALQAGKHVCVSLPVTREPKSFLRLAHVATNHRRQLHLFAPAFYSPAFRTLRGHARPSEVQEVGLTVTTDAGFSSAADAVFAHLPQLQKLVLLGGPVKLISRATFQDGRFEASLLFRSGARGDVSIRPVADGDEPTRELDVQTELDWHIRGEHLFSGSSMTTLTDDRSPHELSVLELGMVAGGQGRPTLDVRGHYHTLLVLQALASTTPTRL